MLKKIAVFLFLNGITCIQVITSKQTWMYILGSGELYSVGEHTQPPTPAVLLIRA